MEAYEIDIISLGITINVSLDIRAITHTIIQIKNY